MAPRHEPSADDQNAVAPLWLVWPRWSAYAYADRESGGIEWIYATGARRKDDLSITSDVARNAATALAKVAHPPGQMNHIRARRDMGRGGAAARSLTVAHDPRVRALHKFYDDYGLLGLSTLDERPHAARFHGRTEVRAGDQIVWALDHAANVSRLLRAIDDWSQVRRELASAPRLEDAPALMGRRIVRTRVDRRRPHVKRATSVDRRSIHIPATAPPWRRRPPTDGPTDTRWRTRKPFFLAACLNPNLEQVRRVVDPQTGMSRFQFRSLIECVYWALADQLNGPVRRCLAPDCQAFFFPTDLRQAYCPKPPDAKQSRCGKRHRARKTRAR